MKTLTTFILAGALALLAQPNQLDLRQDPPTAVQSNRVSSAYTGASGATTYYYWVVTRYPIGFIVPTSPVIVGGASALGGGNSVALGWPAMTGASSYDVLRTTTNAAPSSCTCAVVLATTGTTLTDNGGALSAWPPGGLNSAGVAQAELQINNRDAGAPYITMAVRNAQRTLNYQLGILKNGTAPSYVPSGFIQPYANPQGAMSCVDSAGADCMATRPGPTNYCADVGAVNAYACNLSPAITAYVAGNSYWFEAATTNTGPATVNYNGLGDIAILTPNGADIAPGDIRAGQVVQVSYTGAAMQMQSASGVEPRCTQSPMGTLNVVCFGADPTGVADSRAAILAAAAAGSDVYVPDGTYLIGSTMALPRKTKLTGANNQTTTLNCTAVNSACVTVASPTGADYLVISDISLQGPNLAGSSIGLDLSNTGFSQITNVSLKQFDVNVYGTVSYTNSFIDVNSSNSLTANYLLGDDCNHWRWFGGVSSGSAGWAIDFSSTASQDNVVTGIRFESNIAGAVRNKALGTILIGNRFESNGSTGTDGVLNDTGAINLQLVGNIFSSDDIVLTSTSVTRLDPGKRMILAGAVDDTVSDVQLGSSALGGDAALYSAGPSTSAQSISFNYQPVYNGATGRTSAAEIRFVRPSTSDGNYEAYVTISARQQGSAKVEALRIKGTGPSSTVLGTYADNTEALAGGLVAGDFYRTATGVLMVAY